MQEQLEGVDFHHIVGLFDEEFGSDVVDPAQLVGLLGCVDALDDEVVGGEVLGGLGEFGGEEGL